MGSLDRSRAESEPRENGFQNLSRSPPCLPCTFPFFWASFKSMILIWQKIRIVLCTFLKINILELSLWPRLPWIQEDLLRGQGTKFPLHFPNLWQGKAIHCAWQMQRGARHPVQHRKWVCANQTIQLNKTKAFLTFRKRACVISGPN